MKGNHPLRAFRKMHTPPLSQGDLAGLLDVARETVSRWETNTRTIPTSMVPDVSARTGIPAKELRPDLAELLNEAAE